MPNTKYNYLRKTITCADGKRYDIYAKTPEELAVKIYKKQQDIEKGVFKAHGKYTVEEWTYQCIEQYKVKQNPDTQKKYISRVKHCILNQIGKMRLRDVQEINCQSVMNAQKNMSKTQINEVYGALKFIFQHALANHLIGYDPTRFLEKPISEQKHTRRALTPTERFLILKCCKRDRRYYLFLLMLLCGCRPSEAANCKVSDVYEKNGKYILHIRGTKTAKADRRVPCPYEIVELIENLSKDEYIAQTGHRNKLERTARGRAWKSLKRQMNIELGCKQYRNKLIPPFPLADDLVPYDLRHEYCTQLARDGVDLRDAAYLMGHSDTALTSNLYTNFNPDEIALKEKSYYESSEIVREEYRLITDGEDEKQFIAKVIDKPKEGPFKDFKVVEIVGDVE